MQAVRCFLHLSCSVIWLIPLIQCCSAKKKCLQFIKRSFKLSVSSFRSLISFLSSWRVFLSSKSFFLCHILRSCSMRISPGTWKTIIDMQLNSLKLNKLLIQHVMDAVRRADSNSHRKVMSFGWTQIHDGMCK